MTWRRSHATRTCGGSRWTPLRALYRSRRPVPSWRVKPGHTGRSRRSGRSPMRIAVPGELTDERSARARSRGAAAMDWPKRGRSRHDHAAARGFVPGHARPCAGTARDGDPATLGLRWCFAPPIVQMAALGDDGHPRRGGFLPPVPSPRRMWAGGGLAFDAPLQVGDAVTRTSQIKDVTIKEGRSGAMCFVTVRHSWATERGPASGHRLSRRECGPSRGYRPRRGLAAASAPPARLALRSPLVVSLLGPDFQWPLHPL